MVYKLINVSTGKEIEGDDLVEILKELDEGVYEVWEDDRFLGFRYIAKQRTYI